MEPELHYAPPIINTTQSLKRLIDELEPHRFIAVDTEMDCYYHYHEKICLVQLSTEDTDYLLDPLALDLSPLNNIFNRSDCTAIFHAGGNDIPYLYRDHHLLFKNIFDTYVAADLLNLPSKGLAGLVKMYFDVDIDKKYQRADWTIRPIPADMDYYARHDTHYLIKLREILLPKLKEAKLESAALHSFESLTKSRVTPKQFNPDNWIHIKEVRKLPQEYYGVIKALYIARENIAQELDLALFRVLPDYILVKLALLCPKNEADLLQAFADSSHLKQVERFSLTILQAVLEGQNGEPVFWQKTKQRTGNRLSERQSVIYDRLRAWRNKCVKEGIFGASLLTNRMLAGLVKAAPLNQQDLKQLTIAPSEILTTHGEVILELLNS